MFWAEFDLGSVPVATRFDLGRFLFTLYTDKIEASGWRKIKSLYEFQQEVVPGLRTRSISCGGSRGGCWRSPPVKCGLHDEGLGVDVSLRGDQFLCWDARDPRDHQYCQPEGAAAGMMDMWSWGVSLGKLWLRRGIRGSW